MIVDVQGKRLVVLSNCSHCGAINVLRNAQRVTRVTKNHGFVGGLDLTSGLFEPIITDPSLNWSPLVLTG